MTNDNLQLVESLTYLNAKAAVSLLNSIQKDPTIQFDDQTKTKLMYVRMMSLSEDQLIALLSKSMVTAYTLPGFNLSENIKSFVDQLLDQKREIEFDKRLVKVFQNHQENLPDSNISLQNWIKDYEAFLGPNGGHDPLTQISYANSSGNFKNLGDDQKLVLKDLLKIYDRAALMSRFWDNLQVPADKNELYKDYDLYTLIPDLEEDTIESIYQDTIENIPEEVKSLDSTLAGQSTQYPAPPISKSIPKPLSNVVNAPAPSMKSLAVPSPYKVPLQKDLDLAAQPKKGLVFDLPTNIDLDKETTARKKREEEKIQREKAQQLKIQVKLEDLKNRSKP